LALNIFILKESIQMNAIRSISAVLLLSSLALGAVHASHLGPIVIRSSNVPVAPRTSNIAVAACADGETRLSGGGRFGGFGAQRGIQASFPQGTGWVVHGRNNTAQELILIASILCLQN
jgi:hypothetical protein